MFEHLKTDFENEFRLEQGSIRIGIPPITDAPIFAQLLGEFKKVYPQIELELYEQGSKKVEISVCLLYTSILYLPWRIPRRILDRLYSRRINVLCHLSSTNYSSHVHGWPYRNIPAHPTCCLLYTSRCV